MGAADTADRTHAPHKRAGLLFPLMLIAAVGVIVFSVVGIATMMGWMPGALSGRDAAAGRAPAVNPGVDRYLETCDDCGVVESVRPCVCWDSSPTIGRMTPTWKASMLC